MRMFRRSERTETIYNQANSEFRAAFDRLQRYADQLPRPGQGSLDRVQRYADQKAGPKRYAEREVVLDEAKRLTTRDRNNTYGPPSQDFTRTAEAAAAYGFQRNGKPLSGTDVAVFVILLKLSRLTWLETHRDSWVDIAGYAACGAEVAKELNERGLNGSSQDQQPRKGGSNNDQDSTGSKGCALEGGCCNCK